MVHQRKRDGIFLAVFCMLTASQSNIWFTFSSVPNEACEYYHLSQSSNASKVNPTIDLLLNWGGIMFLLSTPFVGYLLLFPLTGLKNTIRLATTLCFIATIIRCIPSILTYIECFNYVITNKLWHTMIFLHIAQIINGCAQSMVLSPPSKLSVIWFGEDQRVFATAVASGFNKFGTCLSFILGPLIVQKSCDIPKLLYLDVFIASIPFILSWIYFPNRPNQLPSFAAKQSLYAIRTVTE
eukprot:538613_1